MPVPLGLKVKARLVVVFCRVALAFVRDGEKAEALAALRQNYELLACGGNFEDGEGRGWKMSTKAGPGGR
jgi:hypothetical protein